MNSHIEGCSLTSSHMDANNTATNKGTEQNRHSRDNSRLSHTRRVSCLHASACKRCSLLCRISHRFMSSGRSASQGVEGSGEFGKPSPLHRAVTAWPEATSSNRTASSPHPLTDHQMHSAVNTHHTHCCAPHVEGRPEPDASRGVHRNAPGPVGVTAGKLLRNNAACQPMETCMEASSGARTNNSCHRLTNVANDTVQSRGQAMFAIHCRVENNRNEVNKCSDDTRCVCRDAHEWICGVRPRQCAVQRLIKLGQLSGRWLDQ